MIVDLNVLPLSDLKLSRLAVFNVSCKIIKNNTTDLFYICKEDRQKRDICNKDRHGYKTDTYKELELISKSKHIYLGQVKNPIVISNDYNLVKDFAKCYINNPLINLDLVDKGIDCTLDTKYYNVTLDTTRELIMANENTKANHLYNISYNATPNGRGYSANGSVGVVAPTLEKALEAFKLDNRYINYTVLNITHRGEVNIVATE